MKRRRTYILLLLISIIVVLAVTLWASITVNRTTDKYLTENVDNVKVTNVGLLLGTSKNLRNGSKNDFFYNRIDATVLLYKKGKIKNIIISGDNSKKDYNEPSDMKAELVNRGIPDSIIYLDYAGFRTLDAVVRARDIFGQSSFIVISQKFHNQRAVYLAREFGLEAYGYNAKEVSAYNGFKTKLREFFARDKMFLDLSFGVKPKFLGEKITIK